MVATKWAAIIGELARPEEIERRDDDRDRSQRVHANWAAFVGEIEQRDDDRESFTRGRDQERDKSGVRMGD